MWLTLVKRRAHFAKFNASNQKPVAPRGLAFHPPKRTWLVPLLSGLRHICRAQKIDSRCKQAFCFNSFEDCPLWSPLVRASHSCKFDSCGYFLGHPERKAEYHCFKSLVCDSDLKGSITVRSKCWSFAFPIVQIRAERPDRIKQTGRHSSECRCFFGHFLGTTWAQIAPNRS